LEGSKKIIGIGIASLDFFFGKRKWREMERFRNPRMEGSKKA